MTGLILTGALLFFLSGVVTGWAACAICTVAARRMPPPEVRE